MPAVAILSMHTSPLAQPGVADAGGMNVYVRQLAAALARSGASCEVYTRRESPSQPPTVLVEPGFRVHHVSAGPDAPIAKDLLPSVLGKWTTGVAEDLSRLSSEGSGVDVIHGNYWLSAVAAHNLKHALDLPLVTTFHTLERVKAEVGEHEPQLSAEREAGELAAIGCSDAVLASSRVEATQLIQLYDAGPERVEIVPPGVDTAFFSPGDQGQARKALALPADAAIVLFVGRIQPLKGLVIAARAFARLKARPGRARTAHLVAIGGPSGPQGDAELDQALGVVRQHGLTARFSLVPPQPHELLSTYYRAADACIVPSRSESFGLVALEAAACGVPVVASAVGGLAELVDHGRTGYLVGPDDVEGFGHYLGELLDDRSLARLLGTAASERSAPYTWTAAAKKMSMLCQSLSQRELVSCS